MSGLLWEAPFYLQFFEHLLPAVMAEQDRKKYSAVHVHDQEAISQNALTFHSLQM